MEAKLEHPPAFSAGAAISVVIGAFFMVLGILLTLDNLDIFYGLHYWAYWPIVLVLIGAIKVIWNAGRTFGIVLIVAGTWMTAFNTGWVHFTVFDLWPLILIAAGVFLVARAFGWWGRTAITISPSTTWAVLSSRNLVETSRDYSGGDAFAFLGGCRIDLSGAAMTRRPAVMDVTAIWGGVEVLVPEDWEVLGEVVPIMGGFEMKSDSGAPRTAGQLIVRGMAFMGGIEVKSVRRTS